MVAPSLATEHPLDPLSAEEISQASSIARQALELGPSARFVTITAVEPSKESLRSEGEVVARAAEIVVVDPEKRIAHELRVSLVDGEVIRHRTLDNEQPAMVVEEYALAERLVKSDPDFLAALERRGIRELDLVCVDPIPFGAHTDEPAEGRRLVRVLVWMRPYPGGNPYARPIEGITGLVDLYAAHVVWIHDHGVVSIPSETGEYRAEHVGPPRDDLKPIEITQPEGVSFEVEGNLVRWQKWSLRVGFTAREGLVLHKVAYVDSGRTRSILHRVSFSEMSVPYGDPSSTRYLQSPFDIGENLIGMLANPLELGCDCLGVIHYFDAHVSSERGEAVRIPNAICMHEEDYGMLWKHTDFRTGHVEVRRSRRLVISSVSTIGNYEYGFFWYFYLDGTIECEVKATGIISTAAVESGVLPTYGTLVADRVNGMNHQHFFNVRLDFDIDGEANSVYEVETAAELRAEHNPHGNAFVSTSRLFDRESEAASVIDPLRARYWRIENPNALNALGQPVGYKLMPGENVLPFAQPGSTLHRRAGFAWKHLWVTHFDEEELFAAGRYPNQNPGGDGLPRYVQQDRPIVNDDVVVWYSFGLHHIPRPEDWPVMPCAYLGFMLKPQGFFDRNPALDVPPPHGNGHCHHEH